MLKLAENGWKSVECSTIPFPNDPLYEKILFIEIPVGDTLTHSYIDDDGEEVVKEHLLQIELEDKIPISKSTNSIEIATVSAKHETNYFLFDNNKNFGLFPFG